MPRCRTLVELKTRWVEGKEKDLVKKLLNYLSEPAVCTRTRKATTGMA